MSETAEQQNHQEQSSSKVEASYNDAVTKIERLFSSNKGGLKGRKKIKSGVIGTIVQSIVEEDSKKVEEEVKADIKQLLEAYVKFEKEVADKAKELEGLKVKGQKDFTEKVNKVLSKIPDFEDYVKNMENALNIATKK